MAVWKLPKLPSGKERNLPWRAKVKGQVKDFPTRKDAEFWEAMQLRSYALTGLPLTIEALKQVTVGEVIERYLKEKTPLKGSASSEITVLEKILGFKKGIRDPSRKRSWICELSLAAIRKQDAYKFKDERLKDTWNGKPITEGSVKRQIGILHRIFEVAREEWGYENLANPFRGMKLRENPGRERRLKDGELERLLTACQACRGLNKIYVPLAIYLAIETGMREQEIFNLRWPDVDFKDRTIRIAGAKMDYKSQYKGRIIVMTVLAMGMLTILRMKLQKSFSYDENDLIFPMNGDAFGQSWADVVKRAKIIDLHFHDLRHEAGSRFDAAGLTNAEHGFMMGHGKRTMRDRYSHAIRQLVQDKLDRYTLGDKTWAEAETEIIDKATADTSDKAIYNFSGRSLSKKDIHAAALRGLAVLKTRVVQSNPVVYALAKQALEEDDAAAPDTSNVVPLNGKAA